MKKTFTTDFDSTIHTRADGHGCKKTMSDTIDDMFGTTYLAANPAVYTRLFSAAFQQGRHSQALERLGSLLTSYPHI